MTPTSKLRFVERNIRVSKDDGSGVVVKKLRILQQWWEPSCQPGCSEPINYGTTQEYWIKNDEGAGEWRDVPLETE